MFQKKTQHDKNQSQLVGIPTAQLLGKWGLMKRTGIHHCPCEGSFHVLPVSNPPCFRSKNASENTMK